MYIYNDIGYLNVPLLMGQNMPFIFITGARGTGKTYGVFDFCIENNLPFIYMRRTMAEVEVLWKDESLNPFLPLNRNTGRNIGIIRKSKYTGVIIDREINDDGTMRPVGPALGLVVALSTFANLRGFNGVQYKVLFYDEFIPELHVRPIKEEHMAFMNVYETINRNRELEGEKPLLCVCASNANRLDNPLYLGLGLVSKVDRMKRNKQLVSILSKRGILLVNMEDSPISEQKANTALYRMSAGTGFDRMALHNQYLGEEEQGNIGSRPLKEYNPICAVGELCVYKHKSKRNYYISTFCTGSPPTFGYGDTERKRFIKSFGWLWAAYLDNLIYFESRICEILLTKYFE